MNFNQWAATGREIPFLSPDMPQHVLDATDNMPFHSAHVFGDGAFFIENTDDNGDIYFWSIVQFTELDTTDYAVALEWLWNNHSKFEVGE